MNSCARVRFLHAILSWLWACTHLSNICTDLANLGEELDRCHPLVCGKSSLACKVMYMLYETLHQILQSRVGTSRVDQVDVFGDILDSQVLERRNLNL